MFENIFSVIVLSKSGTSCLVTPILHVGLLILLSADLLVLI